MSGGGTPGPISNPAVKSASADGSMRFLHASVGHCQPNLRLLFVWGGDGCVTVLIASLTRPVAACVWLFLFPLPATSSPICLPLLVENIISFLLQTGLPPKLYKLSFLARPLHIDPLSES